MTGIAINTISTGHKSTQPQVELGKPARADGAAVHALVERCKPLDVNSTYAYLLLCEHFADTCVHAARGGETVGFVSAYHPPGRPDVIFVWQVAVDGSMRGAGLAKSMVHELLGRDRAGRWRFLETTVSPSNTASRRLFHSLARDIGAPLTETALFEASDFEGEDHEEETLIRIGPFSR